MSIDAELFAPTVAGGHFLPPAADAYDLGSADAEWDEIYLGEDGGAILGADQDIYIWHRADALGADTGLTNVLVGTPVTPALAANSLIISNVTASGDFLVALNRGGNSEALIFGDGSDGALYLTPVNGGLTVGLAADAPAPDQNVVHIWAGNAGGVTATSQSVLVLEKDDDVSLTFLVPAGDVERINFGDSGDGARGQISYNHTGDVLGIRVAGVEQAKWTTGALAFQRATTVSTSTGALTINAFTLGGDITAASNNADGFNRVSSGYYRADGSVSSPAYGFETDTNTGFYRVTTDTIGVSINGVNRMRWTASAFAFQQATTISTSTDALTLAPAGGSLLFTGTLALTGSRVTQSYHTDITSTNAVTVDSSVQSKVPETMTPYGGDALGIVRQMEFRSAQHYLHLDPSGAFKLTVLAESIKEPLILQDIKSPWGGTYPGVNVYGLSVLTARAIQSLDDKIWRLEAQVKALGGKVE